ncbi:MAG: TonB-dependent receptor [Acidobacteriota bacterium]
MGVTRQRPSANRLRRSIFLLVATASLLLPRMATSQAITGALIGTVKDAQGGILPGAVVRVTSTALIGGPLTVTVSEKGQLRYPALPPGAYILDISLEGFASYHEEDITIGAGATIERTAVLKLAGLAESVVVEGAGSRIEARDPGFGTRFGPEDQRAIPTRRTSMFDIIRAAPGISPTSPSSGTATTVSAFGSGTNENQFLFDGTNFTRPCTGVARAEPGIDFIQEVQIQSVGASAEYGNMQGAVINVVTRQGSARFLYDASYYAQTAGLTAEPVTLQYLGSGQVKSGYRRARYRDATTNVGGPVVRDRLWFFTGYQYLRDYDSQPGTDPALPRRYEQDKLFAKLTWKLTPAVQLEQSFHDEVGLNPDRPTTVTPFAALSRRHISVPAITFGHLTHTLSSNTVWDVRIGRFVYSQDDESSTGNLTAPSRFDRVTGVTTGAPARFGSLTIMRTTAKATLSHFQPDLLGADHQWRTGGQVERGGHESRGRIPTGVRFTDSNGLPFQAISSDPSNIGGVSVTASAFASDAITVGDRLTINAGVRFDHSRAISQDLSAVDLQGRETDQIVRGLGTLYTWNIVSPRLGVTMKLSADGRTVLRASYGRFSQGVLTGELESFHPGATSTTTKTWDPATGAYTSRIVEVNPKTNLLLDPKTRAPRTDEYSIGVDRELGRRLAVAAAYVRKDGRHFIGWTDVAGQYLEEAQTLADGRSLQVFRLVNAPTARRFLLTNPDGYSTAYNGLVLIAEKRRARGWQALGSYTLSRVSGLLPSSGTNAAGAQLSTVSPPNPLTFGRDPNDLTNAIGRLPNDRPHMFRLMGSVDVPRTGFVLAANFQYFSGKPWAATTQVTLPQADQRILLEPRGSRRLSSQSLLDLRLSRMFAFGGVNRVELLLDVLNALNDTAEEGLASDNLFNLNFGQPTVFMDPRRAMVSVRLNLGR